MRLDYITNNGFVFDSNSIEWGEDRDQVRKKLNNKHKADDRTIELAQYFDGDITKNIEQKRDIYENYNGKKNYFFLNYGNDGSIKEVEVHWGIEISTNGIVFNFEEDIKKVIKRLNNNGFESKLIEDGNYLFPSLKMTISDSEHSGGGGHGLAYFYGSMNIDHLLEEL